MSDNHPQDPEIDSPEQAMAKRRAVIDLEYINQLQSSKAFRDYFMRRLGDKIAEREGKILDELTPETEVGKHRAVLAALRDINRMVEEDAVGCRSILGLISEDRQNS